LHKLVVVSAKPDVIVCDSLTDVSDDVSKQKTFLEMTVTLVNWFK